MGEKHEQQQQKNAWIFAIDILNSMQNKGYYIHKQMALSFFLESPKRWWEIPLKFDHRFYYYCRCFIGQWHAFAESNAKTDWFVDCRGNWMGMRILNSLELNEYWLISRNFFFAITIKFYLIDIVSFEYRCVCFLSIQINQFAFGVNTWKKFKSNGGQHNV